MSNWEKRSRPNVPDFSLPVTRGTPSPRKKYKHKPRTAEQRASDRRYHQAHYKPVLVRSEPEYDHAEIERRIASMRLLKARGMRLGKEDACNPVV